MKSERAKVLHPLCGKPMLRLVYAAAAELDPRPIFIVIGQDAERVRAAMEGLRADFIVQEPQLGTGHAVMAAAGELGKLEGDVLVLLGDAPRIRSETLRRLVRHHRATGADMTMLTAHAPDPFGYGRILRDTDGSIRGIVEENDATPEQKKITEVNPSFYCFKIAPLLEALGSLSNDNAKKEYYLTDVVEIQRRAGRKVETLLHEDFQELRGINTRRELAEIAAQLRAEKNDRLMAEGVTLIDPQQTFIDLDVTVGRDVTIHPMVTLEGNTSIGPGTTIRSGTRIADSRIGARAEILDGCVITQSAVGDETTVGPFAHLRKETRIGSGCCIGNFVEVKKSRVGDGAKAAHLTYLGDAEVGKAANIGAGTITCNYDGFKKSSTVIEDGAFVGTDCQLVAPVRIGRGAYIAAGSCITEDVPPDALAIARPRQTVKQGWARRRRGNE